MLKTLSLASFSLFLLTAPPVQASTERTFIDHGMVAPISEVRGSTVAIDANGRELYLILLRDIPKESKARISMLIVDLKEKTTEQVWFSEPADLNGDNYCLFVARNGRLYLSISKLFFEYDLAARKIIKKVENLPGPAMSMDEGSNGEVYFAVYPTSELFSYTPDDRKLKKLAQLDAVQQYPTSLGVDQAGWVYCGIGTAENNIVAYNPATDERKDLAPAEERGKGAGTVVVTQDRQIYGRLSSTAPWVKLSGGEAAPAPDFRPPDVNDRNASLYWLSSRTVIPGRITMNPFSPRERLLSWVDESTGPHSMTIEYETSGASLASIVVGPDQNIYGCTSHPMELWKYQPAADKMEQLGHVKRIGGGNITRLLRWKDEIVGNSYSHGDLYRFNPAKPFSQGKEANPALATDSRPYIQRPRTLLLHPDGIHLLSGGFPGYGMIGGGLLIYNMQTSEKVALIPPDNLVPGQSITALHGLNNGNILFGTSILTPGGAKAIASEALIGTLDWQSKKLEWTATPVPGSPQISGLALLSKNRAAGITSDGVFFLFDLKKRKTIRKEVLGDGSPSAVRGDTAFIQLSPSRYLLMMTHGIYTVEGPKGSIRKIADSPVPIQFGGGISEGRLYFGSGSRLWSFLLPSSLTKNP